MAKIKFVSIGGLRRMPSPTWLIEGLIPTNITGMVYGLEGSHKSFLTLDMMFSVVSGTPFHGRPVQRRKGLYVASEGGPPLRGRLEAWEEARGVKIADEGWMELIMEETIMLDKPDQVEAYVEELRPHDFGFIIFDTLRTSSAGDELAPEVMGAITRSMRVLQRELNATVLVVHHSPKGNPESYAGSGALGTNIATSINVVYDEKSGVTAMKCKKQKDAAKFATMRFTHRQVGKSLVMDLASTDGPHDRLKGIAENYRAIYEFIESEGGSVTRKQARDHFVKEAGMNPRTFTRGIDALKDKGLIHVEEDKDKTLRIT